MNTERPLPIQEMIQHLLLLGFQECTDAVSRQHDTTYLCAFVRVDDPRQISYCCETPDDLFALLSLAQTAASP
jgi:hypothetical protein